LLQAITKLAFGSNTCNRLSYASPRFISQNTLKAAQTDIFWATSSFIKKAFFVALKKIF
jgi:hypothetical protein